MEAGMELRHLLTFQAVARHDSFVRAAEELQYAQSTVTLHIQQLETELGVKLFARQGKKVRLNEAGRALRDSTDQILSQIDTLKQNMRDLGEGETGYVRIGAIEPAASLRLPTILAHFCKARPKVRLSLEVGGSNAVSRSVAAGHLDFGLCAPPEASLGLVYEPLFKEALGLLVPAGHPLAAVEPVSIMDLSSAQLLLSEPGCAYRVLTERVLQEQGATAYASIEIGSPTARAQAVQHGLGVAFIPIEGAAPPRGTVLRRVKGADFLLSVGLVRRADTLGWGRATTQLFEEVRKGLGRVAAVA
jgi:DNA-binding transcriptional LysR family regulator